jgi:ABC-2 type transport system ATP-binding protein
VEQLCDAVTILERGTVVADGGIAELRRRHGGRGVRVELESGATDWARRLQGVTDVRPDGAGVVLLLADGADTQCVLDAARAAGRVVEFAPVSPRLAELFREVVRA